MSDPFFTSKGTVLVVGASGLVGTAAANSFLNDGWNLIAASRREPELLDHANYQWAAVDLQDPISCRALANRAAAVTHVVYCAVHELPGLIEGWSDPQQIETNGLMFRNLLDALLGPANGVAPAMTLRHLTLLQGTKAYGAAVAPMRIPAREAQPRVEHPNFYWVQEDELRARAAAGGFAYTILRPQLIVGPNHGVVMNLPPVIGAFANLRQAEGLPFSYPGGADWVWEAVDARLVGDACLWAATAETAAGETFNLTNGEVFSFRDLWPSLADTLGVATGPDEPISMARYLPARAALWRQLRIAAGLEPLELDALLGESHHYADLCFAYGATSSPPPTYVSTVKIRQAGFNAACNTEESFRHWLTDLIDRGVLARPRGA